MNAKTVKTAKQSAKYLPRGSFVSCLWQGAAERAAKGKGKRAAEEAKRYADLAKLAA